MWYKKENEKWLVGKSVLLPDNTLLQDIHDVEMYGWIWHDNPPQEYLDWLEEQENVMVFDGDLDDFKIAHPNILEQDQI